MEEEEQQQEEEEEEVEEEEDSRECGVERDIVTFAKRGKETDERTQIDGSSVNWINPTNRVLRSRDVHTRGYMLRAKRTGERRQQQRQRRGERSADVEGARRMGERGEERREEGSQEDAREKWSYWAINGRPEFSRRFSSRFPPKPLFFLSHTVHTIRTFLSLVSPRAPTTLSLSCTSSSWWPVSSSQRKHKRAPPSSVRAGRPSEKKNGRSGTARIRVRALSLSPLPLSIFISFYLSLSHSVPKGDGVSFPTCC